MIASAMFQAAVTQFRPPSTLTTVMIIYLILLLVESGYQSLLIRFLDNALPN